MDAPLTRESVSPGEVCGTIIPVIEVLNAILSSVFDLGTFTGLEDGNWRYSKRTSQKKASLSCDLTYRLS